MNMLIKYQEKLAELTRSYSESATLIFRGQSDDQFDLKSSADRRLENQQPPNLIEYLTNTLIKKSRSEGHAQQQGKELNDLELLASLQHNGAATCLIDFTHDFNIALWFACADYATDGKIFVVNRGNIETFQEVTPERAKENIEKILNPNFEKSKSSSYEMIKIHYWNPPANKNRVIAQKSCFIFSAQVIQPIIYETIIIKKADKKEIRVLLKKYYGLDDQSIFRDFTGFALSQGPNKPIQPATSAAQLMQQGNILMQRGKYKEAIVVYDEAILLDPQLSEAYTNRGIANSGLKQYNKAIADHNEAIRLNPQLSVAYYNRGIANSGLKQYNKAIADYDEAIRLNLQFSEAYTNRGNAKSKLKQYKKAIDDHNEAIRLNPQNAEVYSNRGIAKSRLEQYKEAIADHDEAIRLNPQYAGAYNNRGNAKSKLKQYKKAIDDYDEAIRLNPQFSEAYYNRGNAKSKLGLHQEDTADFEIALKLANEQNNTELIKIIQKQNK